MQNSLSFKSSKHKGPIIGNSSLSFESAAALKAKKILNKNIEHHQQFSDSRLSTINHTDSPINDLIMLKPNQPINKPNKAQISANKT